MYEIEMKLWKYSITNVYGMEQFLVPFSNDQNDR